MMIVIGSTLDCHVVILFLNYIRMQKNVFKNIFKERRKKETIFQMSLSHICIIISFSHVLGTSRKCGEQRLHGLQTDISD